MYTYAFIFIYFLSIITLYFYFVYTKKNINILFIIYENILLFLLIGIMEYLFFLNIAYKYYIVYPDDVSRMIINRINYNLINI